MSPTDPVEEVALRLAAIQDALASLPPGGSPQRFALLSERDELRERATRFASKRDASRTTAGLEAELASLRHRRDEIANSRIGYVMSKGGGNQGPASGAWVKLGEQARSAGDLGWMNARISAIEDALEERRQAGPGP